MHCEEKLKLRSHNTSNYLTEVVTKAVLTIYTLPANMKYTCTCFENT